MTGCCAFRIIGVLGPWRSPPPLPPKALCFKLPPCISHTGCSHGYTHQVKWSKMSVLTLPVFCLINMIPVLLSSFGIQLTFVSLSAPPFIFPPLSRCMFAFYVALETRQWQQVDRTAWIFQMSVYLRPPTFPVLTLAVLASMFNLAVLVHQI